MARGKVGDIDLDNSQNPVEHPSYYVQNGYEVFDVLEAFGLDRDAYLWDTMIYIFRAKHKDSELEDLKKARVYLDRKIQRLEDPEAFGKHNAEKAISRLVEANTVVSIRMPSHSREDTVNVPQRAMRPVPEQES